MDDYLSKSRAQRPSFLECRRARLPLMFGYLVRPSSHRQGQRNFTAMVFLISGCFANKLRDNKLKLKRLKQTCERPSDDRSQRRHRRRSARCPSNYYRAFVLDPDGHNIKAVCREPA
jgi:hypothetical protein